MMYKLVWLTAHSARSPISGCDSEWKSSVCSGSARLSAASHMCSPPPRKGGCTCELTSLLRQNPIWYWARNRENIRQGEWDTDRTWRKERRIDGARWCIAAAGGGWEGSAFYLEGEYMKSGDGTVGCKLLQYFITAARPGIKSKTFFLLFSVLDSHRCHQWWVWVECEILKLQAK